MTMSDRVIILNEGVLQQVGTPREVFSEPVNQFVAEFIGSPSMNFFDVVLDGTTLRGDDITYNLSDEYAKRVSERTTEDALMLGIRPEHMTFSDRSATNDIDAILEVKEPVGDDNYLYLRSDDTEFTMRVLGQIDHTESDEISVSFDESDIHIFDKSTGENLLSKKSNTPLQSTPS